MARKKTGPAKKPQGYFRNNWGMMIALLGPLALLLSGIIGLIIYESSYTARVAFDKWWDELWSSSPATSVAGKTVPIVPNVPTYKREHVIECNNMQDKYIVESIGAEPPIALLAAIGLSPDAGSKDVAQRCKAFAQTVAKMETLSQHRHHVYLCPGTQFSIGKGYGFMPAPKGNGILLASNDPDATTIEIDVAPGAQTIYRQWQFYNAGDGCYVMGYSSRRSRTLELTGE